MKTSKQKLQELAQKQKWSNLGAIAGRARLMQEEARRESTDGMVPNLNHFIKHIYGLEKLELKTFKAWKEEGFIVKKGEKGFVFFSAPRVTSKKVEMANGGNFEAKEERFFTCHLFSKEQVEAIA
jgi:hypothetical protein